MVFHLVFVQCDIAASGCIDSILVYKLFLVPHTVMIFVNHLSSTVPQTVYHGGILKANAALVRAGAETRPLASGRV